MRKEPANTSRRDFIKCAMAGAAGVISASLGKSMAADLQAGKTLPDRGGKTPISLIIDDGAPVDTMFYAHPGYDTPLLVPGEFTRRVAETFERFEMRGKFTVIPMPSCLGRIDKPLKCVPPAHQEEFLKLVRERIAPRFDITPEFLTHLNAYNRETGNYQHIYEDAWITRAPLAEIVEYFTLAFQILKNVGLEATGITSPWMSGNDVEKKYAQAVGDAQWNVFKRKLTWYFLHMAPENTKPLKCSVEYENAARGQVVVSVPANTSDIFWCMDLPTRAERLKLINDGIDRLVSPDGRSGRLRQLIETGYPVVLVTHWQSLFCKGTGLGLEGLGALAERIQKVFGNSLEWVTCSEQARRFVGSRV